MTTKCNKCFGDIRKGETNMLTLRRVIPEDNKEDIKGFTEEYHRLCPICFNKAEKVVHKFMGSKR